MKEYIKNFINKSRWKYRRVIFEKGSKVDSKSILQGNNKIGRNSEIARCNIGKGSYISENAIIKDTVIGKFCCIGPEVKIIIGNHPSSKFISTHPAFYSIRGQAGFTYVKKNKFEEFIYADKVEKKVVIIGNDVWIGYGAKIMNGVTIGDGAIIAAGAIVNKNVEPYAIYGGIPAKLIKYRFDEKDIKKLCKFKWWNKSEEWLNKNNEIFEDINLFIDFCNNNNYD